MGFSRLDILVRSRDGRNVAVEEAFFFTRPDGSRITVLVGSEADGASSPFGAWNVLPPFGEYWPACVLHDAMYGGMTDPPIETQEEADLIFSEALESLQVPLVTRSALYEAVRLFGGKAWRTWRYARKEGVKDVRSA